MTNEQIRIALLSTSESIQENIITYCDGMPQHMIDALCEIVSKEIQSVAGKLSK